MTLQPGTLLHNRYRILKILGQGGMGYVYHARDERLGVDVAVKENLFTSGDYAGQFRLEAVILANLQHPNLARVTNHFLISQQGQYLVMDYIEGEDLRQRMERSGPLPEDEAVHIGVALCEALVFLHSRTPPILHRDIKPGNVKLKPDGRVYLVDFGLVKVLKDQQATTGGARAITPGFSPPEQYGTMGTDVRSDIYSLGATLYAALTGYIPEDGLARIMENLVLTPIHQRKPSVSSRMEAVLGKAMALKPADRFQTAGEFQQALVGLNSGSEQPAMEAAVSQQDDQKNEDTPEIKNTDAAEPHPLQDTTPIASRSKKSNKKAKWAVGFMVLLIMAFILVAANDQSFLARFSGWQLIPLIRSLKPSTIGTPDQTSIISRETLSLDGIGSTSTSTLATFQPTNDYLQSMATPTIQVITPAVTSSLVTLGGGRGKIAFASDVSGLPEIFTSSFVSSAPVKLIDMAGGACQPAWSPNGEKLVFISPCAQDTREYPESHLYTVNLDGSGLTALPASSGGDFDPAWSPDGTQIAFTSTRDGYSQIYVFKLGDDKVQRLTWTDPATPARQPAWNPSGSQIAYSLRKYDAWQIWVMDVNGIDPQHVIFSKIDLWDGQPAWSPDGTRLIFSQSKKVSLTTWLMVYDLKNQSSGYATHVENGSFAGHPAYSPDGNWILFETSNLVNPDIQLLQVSTGERFSFISGETKDFDPAWQP